MKQKISYTIFIIILFLGRFMLFPISTYIKLAVCLKWWNLHKIRYMTFVWRPKILIYILSLWDIFKITKNLFKFFFLIYFGNFDVFSPEFIYAVRAFWLISGVLTFVKFVEILKRSTVGGGRYFLIFQSKDMLNLC